MMVQAYNSRTLGIKAEESQVGGYPRLQSGFKALLGYIEELSQNKK